MNLCKIGTLVGATFLIVGPSSPIPARIAAAEATVQAQTTNRIDWLQYHHPPDRAAAITLSDLLELSRAHNPTLLQAAAQVEGERGKAKQAGLWPNPEIGYTGEQIGVMGTPGEFQGGFLRQEIVTAGKRRLSREKYLARAEAAEFGVQAQEWRVANDVRIHYWRTLAASAHVEIEREMLKSAEDRLLTVEEMVNVGQADEADLHQARVLLQERKLRLAMAQNDLQFQWETLTTMAGVDRPFTGLLGELEGPTERIDWQDALNRLLDESPELAIARAKLEADRIALRRERVDPIPNVTLEGAVGHNYEAEEVVYGAALVLRIPLWDRNQGTVRQAKADLERQRQQVRLTELALRRELAAQYRQHLTAIQHVEEYQRSILPESMARYEVRLISYKQTRVDWPSVLQAQQDFFDRRSIYIQHLLQWREAEVAINGFLLVSGLRAPDGVTPPGHIDSIAQPR